MTVVRAEAPAVVRRYYDILTGGVDRYADGGALATLLHPDFDFEGPLAGRVVGAARFVEGVTGFVSTVRSIDIRDEVHDVNRSAIIYDATLPKGVTRLAEFLRIEDGRLTGLRLLYDPADYLAKGGA